MTRDARRPAKKPRTKRGQERLTPLVRSLQHAEKGRATPLDLFRLASKKWRRGERLDIGQLASELNVGRATVFRWIGSREQLYGEVLSQAYAEQRAHILKVTPGKGIERLVLVARRNLNALVEAAPLHKFIEHDPEFAIRVLTSKSSPVQARTIALERELLMDVLEQDKIKPLLSIDALAYMIVRIGESFLYAKVISGTQPEIEMAVSAIRVLASAEDRGTKPRAGTRRAARAQK
jgi:AcrR family transcriptional regulator